MVGSPQVLGSLHRHTHPNIRGPAQIGGELGQPLRPLGEDLERVPRGPLHRAEYPLNERERDFLVEEVAHAVDEDPPGLLPCERKLKPVRPQAEVEALLVGMPRDAAPALREGLGVAVLAPRADLVAAGHGVPRRVRPLDGRLLAHLLPPSFGGRKRTRSLFFRPRSVLELTGVISTRPSFFSRFTTER